MKISVDVQLKKKPFDQNLKPSYYFFLIKKKTLKKIIIKILSV